MPINPATTNDLVLLLSLDRASSVSWYENGGDGRIEMRLAPANNNQMTVRLSDIREAIDIDPATPTAP